MPQTLKIKANKATVNISFTPNYITTARALGFNISKISENAFKQIIFVLEEIKTQNKLKTSFLCEASF